jgi:hypothetical protein
MHVHDLLIQELTFDTNQAHISWGDYGFVLWAANSHPGSRLARGLPPATRKVEGLALQCSLKYLTNHGEKMQKIKQRVLIFNWPPFLNDLS